MEEMPEEKMNEIVDEFYAMGCIALVFLGIVALAVWFVIAALS